MKQTKIFYIVKGTLYRNNIHNFNEDEENNITINKEFRGNNVLEIRKQAFSYFRSILEVLYESKGLVFENEDKAQKDLKDFYFSGIMDETPKLSDKHPNLTGIFTDRDTNKYLTISFCKADDKPYICKNGMKIYDDKTIHFFGYERELMDKIIIENLKSEQKFLTKRK